MSSKIILLSKTCTTALCLTVSFQAAAQTYAYDPDEEIIVQGTRLEERLPYELDEIGSRIEIISGETIKKAGYEDVSQALQNQVPGLYIAQKNGAFDYVNVSLQGSRTKDVLWLVDGVRISNRLYNTTTPLDSIPAHMVERIEVIKGGQGLFYGTQSVAGVINIVTKGFSNRREGRLSVNANTNGGIGLNGSLSGALGPGLFTAYASHDQADGFQPFKEEDYQPSSTDRKRGYDVTTLGAKYLLELASNSSLTASYQHNDAKAEDARPEDFATAFNEREEDIASLKLDWSPTENLSLFVKGYYHNWDSYYSRFDNILDVTGQPSGQLNVVSNRSIWRFEDYGLNILSQYALNKNVTLLAGYDFQKYKGRDDEFLIGQQKESVHAPYAQIRVKADILNGAKFAAGLRHNAPSDGREKTIWNMSGKVNLTSSLYTRGQVGTAFRLPSAYELYVVDPCCEQGNPNLIGESSLNWELGVGGRHAHITWEGTYFQRNVKDLISIDYSLAAYPDGLIVNTNDEVNVSGLELILGAQFTEDISATASYTYTEAKQKGSPDQLTDIPKNTAKLGLNWDSSRYPIGLAGTLNYVGDVFDSVGGGVGRVEHGHYAVLDLSGYWDFGQEKQHRIGFRVENALAREYASQVRRVRRDSDGTSYAAEALGTPRTLHVSYSYKFH